MHREFLRIEKREKPTRFHVRELRNRPWGSGGFLHRHISGRILVLRTVKGDTLRAQPRPWYQGAS
jgi:hypothetical protein